MEGAPLPFDGHVRLAPTQADTDVHNFLRDLEALSQRYGVVLCGDVSWDHMKPSDYRTSYSQAGLRGVVRR